MAEPIDFECERCAFAGRPPGTCDQCIERGLHELAGRLPVSPPQRVYERNKRRKPRFTFDDGPAIGVESKIERFERRLERAAGLESRYEPLTDRMAALEARNEKLLARLEGAESKIEQLERRLGEDTKREPKSEADYVLNRLLQIVGERPDDNPLGIFRQ